MSGGLPAAAVTRRGGPPLAGVLLEKGAGGRIAGLMAGVGLVQTMLVVSLWVASVVAPEPPQRTELVGILVYDPPPPPPPPLPKGSPLRPIPARLEPTRPVAEKPAARAFTFDIPQPLGELTLAPEAGVRPEDQFGSATGSDVGDPLGMEEGVPGGVPGGRPGGVVGGLPWGTGTGPVADFDADPRPIRQPKPRYPSEAFVRKIEGTVELEILIDASGHVTPMRVVRSIPPLDEAARAAVTQWLFQPALKHGRPVAILARAPVTFHLY